MRIRTSSGSRMRLRGNLFSGEPIISIPPIGEIFRLYNNNSGATDQLTYTKIDGTEENATLSPLETRYILALSGSLSDSPNTGNFIGDITVINLLITSSVQENPTFTEQLITTTGAGTWTKPNGVTQVIVECWGGGGAGGGSTINDAAGSGGGGGGYARSLLIYGSAQQNISYNVGAGGTGGTGNGPNGQNTTWNTSDVVARGGQGGTGSLTEATLPGVQVALGGGESGGLPNTGSVTYIGGSGANAVVAGNPPTTLWSGPGGGGAGSAINGSFAVTGVPAQIPFPASPSVPGTFQNEYGGGGAEYSSDFTNFTGLEGSIYAAGGSGAVKVSGGNRSGGSGAQGLIRLIYR